MKAFFGGVAMMIAISVLAAVILDNVNLSSASRESSDRGSVRLGDEL